MTLPQKGARRSLCIPKAMQTMRMQWVAASEEACAYKDYLKGIRTSRILERFYDAKYVVLRD